MNSFEPDDLRAKLRTWKVEPQVTTTFQREVWQRISVRQMAREGAFWPGLARSFFALLTRPQYAFGIVLVSLLAGLGLAHEHARYANAKQWKALETRYATSVDPLSMVR